MKKILTLLSLLGILLLVVACTNQAPASQTNNAANTEVKAPPVALGQNLDVVIENMKFMPNNLEVKVGDMVTWTNKDSVEHTVTFENGDFDQKLPMGALTVYQFTEKGQYRYFCSIHPGMQGIVTVN